MSLPDSSWGLTQKTLGCSHGKCVAPWILTNTQSPCNGHQIKIEGISRILKSFFFHLKSSWELTSKTIGQICLVWDYRNHIVVIFVWHFFLSSSGPVIVLVTLTMLSFIFWDAALTRFVFSFPGNMSFSLSRWPPQRLSLEVTTRVLTRTQLGFHVAAVWCRFAFQPKIVRGLILTFPSLWFFFHFRKFHWFILPVCM